MHVTAKASGEEERFRAEYIALQPRFERLAINLQQALQSFLEEAGIPFLSIQYRIKEFSSFSEKLQRKKYTDPLNDIEDLCGLRIICYYPSDVDRICSLIRREFSILGDEDTAARLKLSEFGYRSYHFIVGIKDEWLNAPNYRGLGSLKAEVQVRTVLMHSWAEIEHKLAYKSEQQVPDVFRRRLYRLSAKFEEADEQFEELRRNLEEYRSELHRQAEGTGRFNSDVELNLDTLQAFMDFHFPDRVGLTEQTRDLFEELSQAGITMRDLVDGYERIKQFILEIESDTFAVAKIELAEGEKFWTQAGAVRKILDMTHDSYFEFRRGAIGDESSWVRVNNKWRERLKNSH